MPRTPAPTHSGPGFIARRFGPLAMSGRPRLVRHAVHHAGWTGPTLTIAVLSDLHICAPWVTLAQLDRIIGQTNALGADLILLGGDFIADSNLPARKTPMAPIAAALTRLTAPLGVFAVLGNHDWFDCALSRRTKYAENSVINGLADVGIPLLRNRAVAMGGGAWWLVGLDSQRPVRGRPRIAFHDPDAAFRDVPPGAPAILLAHEPDYFALGDARAFVQISGHTHGGQLNLGGWRPLTPSIHGDRYAWGHIRDGARHLIVSGGIGYSGLPLRVFQPPEITLVTIAKDG